MTSSNSIICRLHSCFCMAVLSTTMISTVPAFSQDQTTPPAGTAPDNSAKNKHHAVTADKQAMNAGDREITQKIRKAVIADKSLSMYAHNVKIIAADGAVTLKGPVRSDDEKEKIASLAADVVGGPDKVTNQITVKPKQ